MDAETKRVRRPWWRIALLLTVFLLVAGRTLAVVRSREARAAQARLDQQRPALRALSSAGYLVVCRSESKQMPLPDFIADLLPAGLMAHRELHYEIRAENREIVASDVPPLNQMIEPEVRLTGAGVTDASLVALQKVPRLSLLILVDTSVSDAAVQRLQAMMPELTVVKQSGGAGN